jgi:hypothetical protein
VRALFALCALVALSGCGLTSPARVVFRAAGPRATAPAVQGMDCYFATVDAGAGPSGAPSCLALGKASELGTYEQLSTTGLTLRVPLTATGSIRLWGVGTSGACEGKTTVAALFEGGARPWIFPISTASLSLSSSTVQMSNQYVPDVTPNRGACDGGEPVVTSVSQTGGLHRGGADLLINGSGFEIGATATIGGVACAPATYLSSSQIQCTTPALPPSNDNPIVVYNPNGVAVATGETYDALLFLLTVQPGIPGKISSLKVNPDDATAASFVSTSEADHILFRYMTLHPTGKWVFLSRFDTNAIAEEVAVYAINPFTGALTFKDAEPVAHASRVEFVRDKFVVVEQGTPDLRLQVLQFDSGSETLSIVTQQGAPAALDGGLNSISTGGARDYLWTIEAGVVNVWHLAASGELFPLIVDPGLEAGSHLVAHPMQNRLFFHNGDGTDRLRAYSYSGPSLGTLEDLPGNSLTVDLVISPDGSNVYANINGSSLWHFVTSASDPELTQVGAGSFDDAGVDAISVATGARVLAVTDSGDASGGLQTHRLDEDGDLVTPAADTKNAGANAVYGLLFD